MNKALKTYFFVFLSIASVTSASGEEISLNDDQRAVLKEIITSRGGACPEVIWAYNRDPGPHAAKYKVFCGINGQAREKTVYMITVAMDRYRTVTVARSSPYGD